ncbi:SpaH/EbpB family LPXTG-anchored major pilin [Enterococcus pseudoavium]|uniref:SpaH/EbpB family LPXTG-anchored major pilin n=1 Tax=Enterococcus pseudoavium TaxID=44007 RepID=A0ABU3FI59_9ENTE|nr:SpaH/EbpB family LPXTG-anchored major pilin [Enterococcus pseudoavium]MDT2770750.1 SpaH/EbpB family LPXTG-anchored major pilin [Enterococcus pseudoavium]
MKRFARLFMLVITLLASASFIIPSQAESLETVDFVLHKLSIPVDEMPDPIKNTGGAVPEALKDYEGLPDVTFEVYDVSADFYAKRLELSRDGKVSGVEGQKAAQESLVGSDLTGRTPLQTKRTNENGQAAFDNLPAKVKLEGKEKDAVYLFRETEAPQEVELLAEDLVVVLPIYQTDEQALKEIHLYPKNGVRDEPTPPPFEKIIVDPKVSYQAGDIIHYQAKVSLPKELLDYERFSISDDADERLVLQPESLKVTADKTVLSANSYYNQTTGASDHNQFRLDFKTNKLAEFAGKELVIDYNMRLTGFSQAVDQAIINTATLETDFDLIKQKREVYTGGKKFVKVDLADQAQRLSGAQFVIQNDTGLYLQETESGYRWSEKLSDDPKLVHLKSDDQGAFQIMGLKYGDYYLKEIEAPEGYTLNQNVIPFKVEKNTSAQALKIVNKKIESQGILPVTTGPTSPSTTRTGFNSVSRGLLPKTSDSINLGLILIGMLLIVGIIIVRRRTTKG